VVWGRYCACEILIANPIDWLFAACLEYFFFSRSTVQKLENNMMNIVCQSCRQYFMHMTERIFNALHTQTFDPSFAHWRLIKENGADRS
jgi:hypothetical protein